MGAAHQASPPHRRAPPPGRARRLGPATAHGPDPHPPGHGAHAPRPGSPRPLVAGVRDVCAVSLGQESGRRVQGPPSGAAPTGSLRRSGRAGSPGGGRARDAHASGLCGGVDLRPYPHAAPRGAPGAPRDHPSAAGAVARRPPGCLSALSQWGHVSPEAGDAHRPSRRGGPAHHPRPPTAWHSPRARTRLLRGMRPQDGRAVEGGHPLPRSRPPATVSDPRGSL